MASMEEMEGRIRDQRTAEANRKGLVGQAGKIGTVLRVLGSPIVGQTEDVALLDLEGRDDGLSGNPLQDIPVMDMEGSERPGGAEWGESAAPVSFSTRTVGMHFDGLSRSMHLEIIYNDDSSEMSVYYRGHLVYRETQGELVSYVPNQEWEEWVSSLFNIAKKRQRESKEQEFQDKVREATRAKESWLRQIASRWGLT